jgi:hypothetical protein
MLHSATPSLEMRWQTALLGSDAPYVGLLFVILRGSIAILVVFPEGEKMTAGRQSSPPSNIVDEGIRREDVRGGPMIDDRTETGHVP